AWVNGQAIQRTTLVELLNLRNGPGDGSGRPLPPVTLEHRQRALDDIIQMELVAQKARDQGLTATPEAASELAYQRDQVLSQRLMRQLTQETVIDETALRERHAALPTEHEIGVRHIVLATEAAARDTIARLDAGASFADLARKRSIDKESKVKGGLLPTTKSTAFVPPFAAAAVALEPGRYTKTPVATDFGWHVIRLESHRAVPPPPLDEAREWLVPMMVNERVEQQMAAWRQAADVKVLQPLGDGPVADTRGDVATVNGQAIPRVMLEQLVKARNGIENPYDPVDPNRPPRPMAGREGTLEELVMTQVLAQQARARQLDENPSVLAEAELQQKTIAGRMYVRWLISQTRIEVDELKALYRTDVPANDFKVSQIVVAEEAQAAALIDRLDQGARFPALAREFSLDEGTKKSGGSMGWLLNNQMPTAVSAVVRPLKPGRHAAQAVRTDAGWVVVRLDAVRPTARRPGLEEATAWLYPKLMNDKVQVRLQRLRAEADVRLVQ
ncbi:MAG: peptidylprolyl isomerase, partial [Rhizobacter sp.]